MYTGTYSYRKFTWNVVCKIEAILSRPRCTDDYVIIMLCISCNACKETIVVCDPQSNIYFLSNSKYKSVSSFNTMLCRGMSYPTLQSRWMNCALVSRFVMFWCVSVRVDFKQIFPGNFNGKAVIIRLPQCQCSNPEWYGLMYHIDPQELNLQTSFSNVFSSCENCWVFYTFFALSHPGLGWLYVFSSFPPRPPPQNLFPLTSKPFELNLWYLAQRI